MPVEPIAILKAVLATARAIYTWLKDKDRKQHIIDELTKGTQMLCEILQPLQKSEYRLDKNVVSVLLDLAETLTSTKEHLSLWQAKTINLISILGFLNPGKVVDLLRDDQMKLTGRTTLLILALQVAQLPSTNTIDNGSSEDQQVTNQGDYLDRVRNDDVRAFWERNFGEEIFVFASSITEPLSLWVQLELDEHLSNALLLSIDKKGIGVVTPRTLAAFAGASTLKEAIGRLRGAITDRDMDTATLVNDDHEPMLIWIDDNMRNNLREIRKAKELGITVVELPSTAVAKVWIEENQENLRRLEKLHKLRFITDNARWEKDDREGEFMNMAAGKWTLTYLRGLGFTSPVLVYCGYSIGSTDYVKKFSRAVSTVSHQVCLSFISDLVSQEGPNDNKWEGFNVGSV